MSFILDALRKSENERQRAAVPGISDVPAVVHRNKTPGWMLGIIVALTACVLLLGWAWLDDVGMLDQPPAATTVSETQPTRPSQIPDVPRTTPGEVRSLAREARRPESPPSDTAPRAQAPTVAAATPRVSPAPATGPLPTMGELLSRGASLPELNLELHVFSAVPGDRFVFINSSKYLEGESLPEGPRLDAITEEGVVMSHRGQSFLLPRE